MDIENVVIYWKCDQCKIYNTGFVCLKDAQYALEKHEKEFHKGKFIGSYGKNYITDDCGALYERVNG